MATYVIDTDGTSGDYASMAAAAAALPATFTEDITWECQATTGVADTTTVELPNTVDTDTYRLTIQPASGQEHSGTYDSSIYRLEVNIGGGGRAIYNRLANTTIKGLQIAGTHNSTSYSWILYDDAAINNNATDRIYDGILMFRTAASTGTGLLTAYSHAHYAVTANIRNCIIYDVTGPGVETNAAGGTLYAYNNTVINAGTTGINVQSTTVVAINNIVQGSGTADYAGTFDASSDYNTSEDGTDTGGANDATLAVTFANEAGKDFHLTASYAGTDLSGAANYAFSTDIDGDTRSAWDRGADEYTASGTTLTVADAAQAQSADSVALTQANVLAPNDAAQAQAAGTLALVQANTLAIADAAQAQMVDGSLALIQANILALADALQAQSADTPSLTQANLLTVADALQAQSADTLSFSLALLLTVADATQSQTADGPLSLTQAGILAIADALQAQSADAPALVQANTLAVADAVQGQSADNVALSLALLLAVADATQAQAADGVALVQANLLAIADALQAQAATAPALVQANILAVANALQAQAADAINLSGAARYLTLAIALSTALTLDGDVSAALDLTAELEPN